MENRFNIFWTNEGEWPVEKPGFLFLARAMKRIGREAFPHAWTGNEPWADPAPPPLSERQPAVNPFNLTVELKYAFRLLDRDLPAQRAASGATGKQRGNQTTALRACLRRKEEVV